jgi:hypothetical protein
MTHPSPFTHGPDHGGHNRRSCGTPLPLSEVGAGGRLTHTVARYLELVGTPRRRQRYPADLIAASIRDHDGDVWPAIIRFGVSYAHALRIRNGWRPGGRRAAPISWAWSRNVGRRTPRWEREA